MTFKSPLSRTDASPSPIPISEASTDIDPNDKVIKRKSLVLSEWRSILHFTAYGSSILHEISKEDEPRERSIVIRMQITLENRLISLIIEVTLGIRLELFLDMNKWIRFGILVIVILFYKLNLCVEIEFLNNGIII